MTTAKILIADDNNAIRALVEEILKEAGFIVVSTSNGVQALERIYKENPSLCILDYEMPEKDGFEVVKEVRGRAAYVHMPIIIFTASTDKDTKIKGLGLDIDDYLVKPADAEEIVARVKLLLRRSKQKMDSNPLTRLPGNPSIQANVEARINSSEKFAVLYADLNNFKAYNDKYGFEAGDKVLKFCAEVVADAAKEDPSSFVGHIGGDDFIVTCSFDHAEAIAKKIISLFDAAAKSFYNEDDLKQGFMLSHDRRGQEQKFPFLSIGIGVVHNDRRPLTSFPMVSNIATELKGLAKKHETSYYYFDRREN